MPSDKTVVNLDETEDSSRKDTNNKYEVELQKGTWLEGAEGFQFNKKCKVRVEGKFLKKTNRTRVSINTFSTFRDEKNNEALREKPDLTCRYTFTAQSNVAKKVMDKSEELEMPQTEHIDLKEGMYDDLAVKTYPSRKAGEKGHVKGEAIKSLQENLQKIGIEGIGKVDGDFGGKTKQAVIDFQKAAAKKERMKKDGKIFEETNVLSGYKEGIVDKITADELKKWIEKEWKITKNSNYLFPIKLEPEKPYNEGMRRFGASRSKGRKHAGCDLYTPFKTPVYAIEDGSVVIDPYHFYCETDAIEINHTDFIIRYGEIIDIPEKLKKGTKIKRGDFLGNTGKLIQNGKALIIGGKEQSMLHIEFYSGTETGALTQKNNGTAYKRRKDVFNPATILDKAKKES